MKQNETPKTEKRKKFFNALVVTLASVLVIAGIITGVWFFIFYRTHEQTNDAQIDQYITPIAGRVTGYIKEVRFIENQFVHEGDTLVVIDNRENASKLAMAEADLETAQKNINVLQEGVSASSSTIAVRKAQLDASKAQLWKAEQDYNRYNNLLKEEAVTEQQFEQAKATYESAKAHYREIQNSIVSNEVSTTEASSRIPSAQAVIKAREAAVQNASLFLSYTVVIAPYDGWVGKKTIQPGQLVKEGQTLVSMVSKEKWITANFKETQVKNLYVGQPVTFKVDALGNETFHGVVGSLSPASGAKFSLLPPDNATGNFVKIEQRIPVRIELSDSDTITQIMRAGMNVVVTVKDKK
ncbi:membrane fusion protein (multidrug efflux system) [Chitinophaga skermanii]|uniref:Membrane fusion protein (Multidrug efflux system) n=1 Tax=Chitinophaga skermanii TaxID=331697 RepID=A0A327QKN2_9BACT|nr:HlyD family secretion protein [Chitinophaga skermanii]RAJ02317.1 membrane fusion protein (multidrug efflux system) [Chitinophaga skermanii]